MVGASTVVAGISTAAGATSATAGTVTASTATAGAGEGATTSWGGRPPLRPPLARSPLLPLRRVRVCVQQLLALDAIWQGERLPRLLSRWTAKNPPGGDLGREFAFPAARLPRGFFRRCHALSSVSH